MATNGVQSDIGENGATEQPKGNVKEIKKEWSVIEDGALAIRLQEEENVTHYSGNINRRRTVRSDIRVAKTAADEEAIKAFKEEHDIAEKNRQREVEDAEAAQKLLQQMMEEEKKKLREQRQKMNEEADKEAAEELYRQMMEEERSKMRSRKSFEETDAELALRLQAHEEKKKRILKKQHSLDQMTESERLAHHLAREEKYQLAQTTQYGHREEGTHRHRGGQERSSERRNDLPRPQEPPRHQRGSTDPGHRSRPAEPIIPGRRDHRTLSTPEGHPSRPGPAGARLPPDGQRSSEHRRHREVHNRRADYLVPDVKGLQVAMDPEPVQDLPPRKHIPKRMPRQQSAPEQHNYDEVARDDSDEETNIIAKIQDDEELARRLQREEIQKSRAKPQMTDKQRNQLINDQKIAIKMQHEEVMFSKKSTYDSYMGKVRDEIADPEPMVHVNPKNKTPVHADAKYGEGVQLTDYMAKEGAQARRTSAGAQAGAADGNIIATIDPTYNRKDSGNVVLLKKKSIPEEPLVDEGAFSAVQGSKRRDSKDKGKRGSIFSKLKKK